MTLLRKILKSSEMVWEALSEKGRNSIGRSRFGHHKKAISEGLRKGSAEAGRVMAKWRWKKGS